MGDPDAIPGERVRHARLDGEGVVDPHPHIHNFIFAAAKAEDGFRQVDGKQLYENAEWLTAAFENEISRLEQEAGIQITFKEPTRTGRIDSEIKGSNPEVRNLLSTNTERSWQVRMNFERKYGRPPSRREYEREMQKTKGNKSKAAKEADAGDVSFWQKIRRVIDEAGLEMTVAAPVAPSVPSDWESRTTGTSLRYFGLGFAGSAAASLRCRFQVALTICFCNSASFSASPDSPGLPSPSSSSPCLKISSKARTSAK
jgi:hypothetical protein